MNEDKNRIVSHGAFVVRYRAAGAYRFEAHSHPYLTVTSVMSGMLEAEIGSSRLVAAPEESLFTNSFESHSGNGSDLEFVSVGITAEAVAEAAINAGFTKAGADITFNRSYSSDRSVAEIARAIAAEALSEEPGRNAMLDALISQLVIVLLRSHLRVKRSPLIELSRAGPVDRRLRRAMEFMHDNYSRDLGIEEIAQAAYLSEYHFARLFRRVTGVTPHAYLANLRLEQARELLINTRESISDIAGAVGYQSQSHFTKAFKAVTGLTPRSYREGTSRAAEPSEVGKAGLESSNKVSSGE